VYTGLDQTRLITMHVLLWRLRWVTQCDVFIEIVGCFYEMVRNALLVSQTDAQIYVMNIYSCLILLCMLIFETLLLLCMFTVKNFDLVFYRSDIIRPGLSLIK